MSAAVDTASHSALLVKIRDNVKISSVYTGVQNECDPINYSKSGVVLLFCYWFVLYLSCAGIQSETKSEIGTTCFFWGHEVEAI